MNYQNNQIIASRGAPAPLLNLGGALLTVVGATGCGSVAPVAVVVVATIKIIKYVVVAPRGQYH